jgi:hypothetical protein
MELYKFFENPRVRTAINIAWACMIILVIYNNINLYKINKIQIERLKNENR